MYLSTSGYTQVLFLTEDLIFFKVCNFIGAMMTKKQDTKKKKQEEELPLITLDSCETIDPSAENRQNPNDEEEEIDFELD